MASAKQDTQRAGRLYGLFRATIGGERAIRTTKDAELFLEAVRAQKSPSTCVETIISQRHGLEAIRESVRLNLSTQFIQAHTLPFLRYLSDPTIKALGDGQLLQKTLVAIADPPTLWNVLLDLFKDDHITGNDVFPFAWLALELVLLPPSSGIDVVNDVQAISKTGSLPKAAEHEVRELGYRIANALQLRSSPQPISAIGAAGGRHDNDHADFRKINIYPTMDEFLAKQLPFFRTAQEVAEAGLPDRLAVHLDNQFRQLREDMLAELREDIQVATGIKKGRRPLISLSGLTPVGLGVGDGGRFKKVALQLECLFGLGFTSKLGKGAARKQALRDTPSYLKHQSFGVMLRGKDILGFAFVDRDIDLLAQDPPVICLQFTDVQGLQNTLMGFKTPGSSDFRFVLVDTPVFAYEPVLKGLQETTDLPLHDILVDPKSSNTKSIESSPTLHTLVQEVKSAISQLKDDGTAELPRSNPKVHVDASQLESVLLALTRPIALIQGPPGTGKSFIGARVAKYLHDGRLRILILSYTNHALNQFLEDLMDVGIPEQAMIRIGGTRKKCSDRTSSLLLSDQRGTYRRPRGAFAIIDEMRRDAQIAADELEGAFEDYQDARAGWKDLSEYLEFSDEAFYEALQVPSDGDSPGWKRTGKGGKQIQADYLFQRWVKGEDAGIFQRNIPKTLQFVWDMDRAEREKNMAQWRSAMFDEVVSSVGRHSTIFNNIQSDIDIQFAESDRHTLLSKTVIGCTTTGAAKYARLVRAAKPDIVLVEEAGEILESHILTALAPSVKQIILIGDHKQLRPKINNYALSVEKGDGFDLNRSLFERLVMQGATHTTLRKQHRMAREISVFPRALTYPDLLDGPKTLERPRILGLANRVIWFNHSRQEDSDKTLKDRQDPTLRESKRNTFEAEIILRCVRYLGQQGYSNDRMVVLAPYVAQIRTLQEIFHKNKNDLQISDMDKLELTRAGLISEIAAKGGAKALRLSSIDNYQGEESDIVIASMTRCNDSGDIGFMYAPERLNVLITRARNCLIMIGNMATFMKSKKGRETWPPFFDLLKQNGQFYEGIPVVCERHPEKTALLKEPSDFDWACPDGGCDEQCTFMMACGVHPCPLRCHQADDHSKMPCHTLVEKVCERQHKSRMRCERQKDRCKKCIKEDEELERRAKRDLKLEEERVRRQELYQRELQEIQDKIDEQRRILKYQQEEQDQKKSLEQQKAELEALKGQKKSLDEQKKRQAEKRAAIEDAKARASQNQPNSPSPTGTSTNPDSAQAEWDHMKQVQGARSGPIDELMGMIGLETVKQKFLSIKSQVDTTLRQGISFDKDRYGCAMLGNPGTGKTTVARLYAQFLTEVGVIPGSEFKETTGAALANLGVSGCKKLVDEILGSGGGVLFIDEAYQLTSGNNPGGGAVLDYLLAEVENLTGKVVFVLAGYDKQMETFFAHNPGIPSRFPHEMKFEDYTDDELLDILVLKTNKKYQGAMSCDDGHRGLYCRIVTRRIGRGRGKEGFGNARTVENHLQRIGMRQADRLRRERKAGKKTTDIWSFTKEDLIGPEPAIALQNCKAWTKLQSLVGLGSVKEAVKALVDSIQQNYHRELAEQPPIEYSLNKVFLGSPGTGKTTVAKLYGEILVDIGLLSKGEVVVKNPSDFIAGYIGQSEQKTKGILAATLGKVLVIDEAYGLFGGGKNESNTNSFKTAIVDTIVAEVQSVPGDDRCVLLLGYKDQMENMFQNVNPGLARRFPIASGFVFDDFTDDELRTIFDKKLKDQGYLVTDQAANVAMDMLKRARNRPNFGNAGEIDILLDATKARHQRRVSKGGGAKGDNILEAKDFDEEFDRAERTGTNVKKLFEGSVGCEQTIQLLEGYQETVRIMKSLDMDPKENIPFNFLFRGPPGTGKTTTARKIGKVFYDMGFLSTAEVVECSASDLVGQYVGHTGPKVQQLFDKALGRVLFIDEAYRLGEGHFAKEAMDEIVDSVTKTKYFQKLIIILAGYEADINRLMSTNPGLTSRFPEVIDFRALSPDECMLLLLQLLVKQKETLKKKGKGMDLVCLQSPSGQFKNSMVMRFTDLARQDNWASARDVQNIGKSLFNKLLRRKGELAKGCLTLHEKDILDALDSMFKERESRSKAAISLGRSRPKYKLPVQDQAGAPPAPGSNAASADSAGDPKQGAGSGPASADKPAEPPSIPPVEERAKAEEADDDDSDKRDAGVSDDVWEQLQRDRKAEKEREAEFRRLEEEGKKAAEEASEARRDAIIKRLLDEKKQLEEAERRRLEEEKKKADEEEARRQAIIKRLMEEGKRREEEQKRRLKLRQTGKCPMGYEWVAQAGGYRCRGGSHWVPNSEVDRLMN